MDIISLSSTSKQRLPRRHTTEVQMEHLPKWKKDASSKDKTKTLPLSTTHLAPDYKLYFEESSSQEENDQQVPVTGLTKSSLTASWHSLEDNSDFVVHEPCSEYQNSQADLLQEMGGPFPNRFEANKHGYQLSYELALDNMLTPFAPSALQPYGGVPTSYTSHVIMEILTTERTYVGDLSDIVEGYIIPLESRLGSWKLNKEDIDNVFGNVREIKDFNSSLLRTLNSCGDSSIRVGQCFLEKAEGFKTHYSSYCNNYPKSVQVLARLTQDESVSKFLKICQQRLNHMLPLGAYLLKPVQRVLKYSLLLEQLVKHMPVGDPGFTDASFALDKMTSVSKHINEMKKKYDAAIHIQELQSLIRGSEDIDLTKAGDLVLEENMRYGGRATGPTIRSRADRNVYVFLFRKMMLMTKREDDGFQYKLHLEMKDIQLTERVEKEANCFQVRQVSTGNYFTLQAPSQKSKERWVKKIKMLLMESIPGLPDKAKMLIMAGFPTDFGDISKRSPKSLHHQKYLSGRSSPSLSRNEKRTGSRLLKTSSNPSPESRAKPRSRSSTTPNLLTDKLVQASLMATLQLEPFQEKSSAEEVSAEAVHAQRSRAHESSSELNEMTIEENKINDEVNVAEPEERQAFLPTVTITSPALENSDSLDQTGSSDDNVLGPKLHTGSPDVQLAVTVSETQQAAEHSPNGSTENIHSDLILHSQQIFMDEDEEPVQLTRVDSLDSVDEENVNDQYIRNPRDSLVFEAPPMFQGSDSESEFKQSAPIHPAQSGHLDFSESHSSSVFTDYDESLFNDLMSKTVDSEPCTTPQSSLDQRDAQTLQSLLDGSQDSISEPDDTANMETPQLAPPVQFAVHKDEKFTPIKSPSHCSNQQFDDSSVTSATTGHHYHTVESESNRHLFPDIPFFSTIAKHFRRESVKKTSSVVRSHSYTSQHQRRIIHKREGSRSSGNSPEVSPKHDHKEKMGPTALKAKHHPSVTKGSISVVGLISTTRNDLSLEDSCDPILDHDRKPQNHGKHVHSSEMRIEKPRKPKQIRSREKPHLPVANSEGEMIASTKLMNIESCMSATPESSFSLRASSPKTTTLLDIPIKGNPNEELSFDEVLRSYDHYASVTGKTTKTKSKEKRQRSQSPNISKKEVKRKDRKRSMTVANIDAATVRAARETVVSHASATPDPPRRRVSRVQQLAREYSRKIKDHQKSSWLKRFSTVTEESPEEEPKQEPGWLKDLRERKRSEGSSQEGNDLTPPIPSKQDELGMVVESHSWTCPPQIDDTKKSESLDSRLNPGQSSMALMAEYATSNDVSKQLLRSQSTDFELDRIATPDPVELQRKGGLKGWVKSVVVKFGGKK